MDDWVYATLYLVSNCDGVERRDASRLLAFFLFIPLEAGSIRGSYRDLVLAPSSVASGPLSSLDAVMREELRRILPSLPDLIAD